MPASRRIRLNALNYDTFSCTVDINVVVSRHIEAVVLLSCENKEERWRSLQ